MRLSQRFDALCGGRDVGFGTFRERSSLPRGGWESFWPFRVARKRSEIEKFKLASGLCRRFASKFG
jgi:hypothetical protein